MKTKFINTSRPNSDDEIKEVKNYVVPRKDEAVIYSYERFHVGNKKDYEAAKKRVANKK